MTDLKGLTEKEFNQLKPKAVYPTVTEDLQEELTFSQKTSKELETGYEGLRKVIFKGLLRALFPLFSYRLNSMFLTKFIGHI